MSAASLIPRARCPRITLGHVSRNSEGCLSSVRPMRNAEWTKDARVVTTRDFSFALLGTEPDSAEAPRRRRFVLRGDPETFAKLSRCLLLDDVLVPARAFAL